MEDDVSGAGALQLVLIFGPPAVGKMTVGRAVAARSTFRLFHNHALIEPLLDVFDYGTPPFARLLPRMRQQVIEEAAAFGIDLVLTFVWGLELEGDHDELSQHIAPYVERGATVSFVELAAGLEERLQRNRTEHRLAEKRSKRDVEWSDSNLRDMERHVLNTGGSNEDHDLPARRLLAQHRHLRLDVEELSAEESAERILRWLGGSADHQ
jgi:hypothetical protein